MKQIVIHEEFETNEELFNLLNEITKWVQRGYSSGVYPTWEIKEVD